MEFVSIGPYCETTIILDKYKIRLNAYPFDYIFSSLEMVKHAINDKFNIFLDKQYYTKGTDINSTRHSFYCKYLDTDILYHHHVRCNYSLFYKASSGNLFNHHNLLDNTVYEQFVRRCNRLLDLINNQQTKTVFVYYNCYTNEFDDVIDFSNYFANNKNIYTVGILQNKNEKQILYENSNCKIYQNYDNEYIFGEINSGLNL